MIVQHICKQEHYGPEAAKQLDYKSLTAVPHTNYDHNLHAADGFGPFYTTFNRFKRGLDIQYPLHKEVSTECQPIQTKTCHQVPILVPKKVPYETCTPVATLDCGLVMRNVSKVECVPRAVEKCKDEAKDSPYIVTETVCEEVVYDECQEVGIIYRLQQSLNFLSCRSKHRFRLKSVLERGLGRR